MSEFERKQRFVQAQMRKGKSRRDAEAAFQALITEEKQPMKEYVQVTSDVDAIYKRELDVHKSVFISDFLEVKKREDYKNFEANREKFTKQGAELWKTFQAGKRKYNELEERSHREIMKWKTLEKPLRQWLENEGAGRGWSKEMIENTVNTRKHDFETAQHIIRERRKSAAYNVEEDFKRRMLDPATRKAAIQHFLYDSADKPHFLIETIELLFAELDKLRR